MGRGNTRENMTIGRSRLSDFVGRHRPSDWMAVSNELGRMYAAVVVAYYKAFYRRVACRSRGKIRKPQSQQSISGQDADRTAGSNSAKLQ
jgi:hypothetical protein